MLRFKLQEAKFDWPLLCTVLVFLLGGLFLIFDATPVLSQNLFGEPFFFLRNQVIFVSIGLLALTFLTFFDYRRLAKFTAPLLFLSLIFLLLVLFPQIGTKIYGARRWISFGSINFQPSELIKLSLIIFFSSLFAQSQGKEIKKRIVPFLILVFVTCGLVLLEPDLGTTVIIFLISFSIYFLAGGPILKILPLVPIFAIIGALVIFTSPYRLARIKTFLNPGIDPQGISYQLNQILIALSNGGILGQGLGESRQKFAFLPEVHTDSIFAVLAEEFGFLGGAIFVLLLIFLLYRIFKIASCARDDLGRFLALGIGSWIGIQSLVNLSSMVAIFPLTGVPLPFISYGGSSLVITMAAMGILLNISRQRIITK